jgi:hypothetical protein
LYAACTEGIAKAWISSYIYAKNETATIDTFAGFNSLAVLLASPGAGAIWQSAGPEAMFLFSATVPLLVALYF